MDESDRTMASGPEASEAKPGTRILVLDTAAFLAGTDALYSLYGLREIDGKPVPSLNANEEIQFFTTPDVVQEVKDPNARARLQLLEGLITLRVPSKESLAAVIDFAKASGDFASLSLTDLRVVALARMLEFERNGTEFMKITPDVPHVAASRGIPLHVVEAMEEAERIEQEALAKDNDEWVTVAPKQRPNVKKANKNKKKKKKNESSQDDLSDVTTENTVQSTDSLQPPTALTTKPASASAEASGSGVLPILNNIQSEDSEINPNSDEGWITPENVELYLAESRKDQEAQPADELRVGCVTTDFAMQNILLQMGIKVVSVDGRKVIRKIRRYVLRCHACTHICRDLERKFCDRCGNATLHRVAYKVNKAGVARIFVNPKRKANLRGTRYSIPMPKGGRNNRDLILREDQVDPVTLRRIQKQKAKLATDVLDPGAFYNAGAKFHVANDRTIVGYGRRNPNESRPGSKSRKR